MNDSIIRVFVNERAVEVPRDAAVLAAVAAFDAGLAERVRSGAAYVTDARAIQVPIAAPLVAGSILRVVTPSRSAESRADDADADA